MQTGTTRNGKPYIRPPFERIKVPDFDIAPLIDAAMDEKVAEDGSSPDFAFDQAQRKRQSPPNSPVLPPSKIPRIDAQQAVPLSRSHRKRRAKRQAQRALRGHAPSPTTREQVYKSASTSSLDFSAQELPACQGAYVGRVQSHENAKTRYSLDEIKALGFQHIQWDGRTPKVLADKAGIVFAILHGSPPQSEVYATALADFTTMMDDASKYHMFDRKTLNNRRGPQPSLHFGISMGMGTQEPMRANNHNNTELVEKLTSSPALQHLAGYSDWVLSLWEPRLYAHYQEKLNVLYELRPNLKMQQNFPGHSILPASTLNFGKTESYKHTDPLNIAYGMCSIQSAGNFNPVIGGQLILWDCRLVIDFPPGATVLVLSAVITHSNTTIQPGESRHSFTQYCSGGIIRWVDEGGKKDGDIKRSSPVKYLELQKKRKGRWVMGLGLLSTLDDFRQCL